MRRIDLTAELERHHRAAFGWALNCCRWARADAEDVLQASYLKILDGHAAFSGRSSFRTWLFGVIRRTAAEHRRRRALHRWLPIRWLENRSAGGSAEPDAEAQLVRSEASARLIAALLTLSPRQRDLLHLVFYQDFTVEEAADALGVSLGTARTHYERAKQRLRELLRDTHDA